ncbi:hypothetical protein N8083_01820 [Candidatus Pacebacteria bacterium]|nr:hypothetical protein [Candidatus Paceibacterota bacterium]
MNEDAREFVKRLLEEGQRYDDVRRALISEGHGTKGFEKEYPEIQKEMGITEPPPTKVSPHAPDVGKQYMQKDETDIENTSPNMTRVLVNIAKLASVVIIIGTVFVLATRYEDVLKEIFYRSESDAVKEGLTPTDITRQTQLKGLQLTASRYKAQLTDYDGVCESIGIDSTIHTCKESTDWFLIEVLLTNGLYYCVDGTGFADIVLDSREVASSCE